jgi:glycosyltransferase involved in cell wall biosynthesis
MAVPQPRPAISVITATYNRSNVLRHSIESLLRSEFADWELLVIGDACTDDTEEVVASFPDRRIRFHSLKSNFGEQSGPNNEGFNLARGKYIAYLNHDDLYFPDHLGACLHSLETTDSDLAFAATAAAARRSPEQLAAHDWRFSLLGVSASGYYEPYLFAPASSWLLKRSLIESIGPWRPAMECVIESSQDFLFRALRAGKKLRFTDRVTVLAVQSGARQDVYRRREDYENAYYAGQIRDNPGFREQILLQVALQLAGRAATPKMHFSLSRAVRKLIYPPAIWLGVHPRAIRAWLKGRGKGTGIDALRRLRGLEPLARRRFYETRSVKDDSNK